MEIIERRINHTSKNSSQKHYMMSVKTLHFNLQKYLNPVFNQIQDTILMRFYQQKFSRTFKNSNATKTNLSEHYHSSYVTGCTTNLTLLDVAYQDAAAAVSLERYFELFGEEFKYQVAKLRHLRQTHRNARLIISVAILNNFRLEHWYVLTTILLFQLMQII